MPRRISASVSSSAGAPAPQSAPAFTSFLDACKAASYNVPSSLNDLRKFLKEAQVADLSSLRSRALLEERCAALVWARESLKSSADPASTWAALPAALSEELLALYPVPPYKGIGSAPPALARLADMIVLFTPNDVSMAMPRTGGPQVAPPPGGIDTTRPNGAPAPTPATPAQHGLSFGQGPRPAGAGSSAPGAEGAAGGGASHPPAKRKQMSHEELAAKLPPAVYFALDNFAHLEFDKKQKLHASLKAVSGACLFYPCVTAPFAHQSSLSYSRGAAWNTTARALALAAAGRSVCIGDNNEVDSGGEEADLLADEHTMQAHRSRWDAIRWNSLEEIGASSLGHCWQAVNAVMRRRAKRSKQWNCDEVADACALQYRQIKTYPAEVQSAITIATSACPVSEQGRARNKEYFSFFYPFWAEHILGRGRIDAASLTAAANAATSPPPPPYVAPPPQLALPTLPPAGRGAPLPPPPPLGAPVAPGGRGMGRGRGAPADPMAQQREYFLGLPTAPVIVGEDRGIPSAPKRPCRCPIAAAFPASPHCSWECPIRYHARYHACPGWTAAGTRIPGAWIGNNLAPATVDEWKTFIGRTGLIAAFTAPGQVQF